MTLPRLVVAGTHSGVGKTTVTLAIMAAMVRRGRRVQPFKVGPDFIDPGHHRAATGRPSRNLDGWMLGRELNRSIFVRAAADADVAIIEGMMGLYDGSSPISECGSTAELAKHLDAPVLLVVDGSAMARSVAALVSGYARFDPALRVAGVVFNRVNGDGHYALLKQAVEHETEVAVVGYVRSDQTVTIRDRHLGLITAVEHQDETVYSRLARSVEGTVDLGRIDALARTAGEWEQESVVPSVRQARPSVRVGVAQDEAFCFYYPDNLDLLQAEGAELVPFSPITDNRLPEDITLLYLGGGYPEVHGAALSRNVAMREAIRAFAERDGAIYAECGGLMYLTRGICDVDGAVHEMVGLFPADATMRPRGLTLGYRQVEVTQPCLLGPPGTLVRGHEFHYSTLVPRGSLAYACALHDVQGAEQGVDGLMTRQVLASYTHLHFASQPRVAAALLAAARGATHQQGARRGEA